MLGTDGKIATESHIFGRLAQRMQGDAVGNELHPTTSRLELSIHAQSETRSSNIETWQERGDNWEVRL